MIAYQIGSTNAFRTRNEQISSAYVDGVSITHGDPKKHVWTFAAALTESSSGDSQSRCPCLGDDASVTPPGFVGMDYFCDTSLNTTTFQPRLYSADPLWDGAGCEPPNTCCSFNTPPWFYKQLPQPTTDDIEMRVCRDEPASSEDIAIEMIELYVQ